MKLQLGSPAISLTAPRISGRVRRFYYYSRRGDLHWDTGLLNRTNSQPRRAPWL
jgi:hypothetical protein